VHTRFSLALLLSETGKRALAFPIPTKGHGLPFQEAASTNGGIFAWGGLKGKRVSASLLSKLRDGGAGLVEKSKKSVSKC